jgi:6-phosphogluconolactonase
MGQGSSTPEAFASKTKTPALISKHWFLGLASIMALLASLALSGCGANFFQSIGTGTTGGGTTSFLYVTNTGGTLAEFALTAGVLTALSGSPMTLAVAPTCVVVAPNNAFAYVGTASGAFEYTINSDGTLTEGNSDNIAYINASGYIPRSMVIDATDSWLIIAYQSETEIDAVQLDATTGLPTGNVFSLNSTFADPSPQLAISAANTQVFVALGTGGTQAFGFSPTGTTAPSGPWGTSVSIKLAAANASANGVAIDPTSTYLFIAEANNNSSGTATAGTLRMIATANLGTDLDDEPVGIGPSAVLADLSGAYVYVANGTDGTISGFSLSTTSKNLTSLGTAFPTEQSPVALVEDTSKSYVISIGNKANPNLWLYSFDTSSLGTLDVGSTTSTATVNPSLANGIAATH